MNKTNLAEIVAAIVIASFFTTSCSSSSTDDDEWISLFDGSDINDWTVKIHHHQVGENFGDTFRVENGLLRVNYDQYAEFNHQYGHIYYNAPFSDFHLQLEYRFYGEFLKDAPHYAELNSGVMFHSQSPYTMPKEQNWPISVEMQFLADMQDGSKRTTGNMCSPGTDVSYQGKTFPSHCLNSNKPAHKTGTWVKAELIVNGNSVTQIIDGQVVLEYTDPVIGGKQKTVVGHDPALWIEGKPLTSGYIALQSEGHPIEFKNIRIKN